MKLRKFNVVILSNNNIDSGLSIIEIFLGSNVISSGILQLIFIFLSIIVEESITHEVVKLSIWSYFTSIFIVLLILIFDISPMNSLFCIINFLLLFISLIIEPIFKLKVLLSL